MLVTVPSGETCVLTVNLEILRKTKWLRKRVGNVSIRRRPNAWERRMSKNVFEKMD